MATVQDMAADELERLTTERQLALGDMIGLPKSEERRAAVTRRPGRPPGARNRRSETVAQWIRDQVGDVLLQQAIVACMPVDVLVAAGLSLEKAFEERRLAATVVLPFVEMRQPLAVNVAHRQVVQLTIVDAGEGAGPMVEDAQDIVTIQQVSGGDDAAL
jgi:hypothetical protein